MLQQHPNLKISFVRRQEKCVAYSLTKTSKLYARHQVFDSILSCICTIMMNEVI